MSTQIADGQARMTSPTPTTYEYNDAAEPKGLGWVLFAGIMMSIAGTLNVIWGIAAIGNAHFFNNSADYIFGSLNTWGWVTLIFGVLQLCAAFSIWAGGGFGRWFGIFAAGLASIAALLAIPAYPFWALAIFSIDILVIYGPAAYGGDRSMVAP